MNFKHQKRRGFTLIEMMVSIGIIAVLALLGGSAWSKVGEISRRTACVSNLRQWGAALQLYVSEHNGSIPRRGQGVRMVTQFDRTDDWFNALPPYLDMEPLQTLIANGRQPAPGEKSVFVCPAAVKGQEGAATFLSYGMNMYLSQWNQPEMDNINNIAAAAQLAFMADSPGGYSSTIPSATAYSVAARHGSCANVVFCDGHVLAFKGSYLGCGTGEIEHVDVRWLPRPDSNAGTPVK